jgi:hypothetical protein
MKRSVLIIYLAIGIIAFLPSCKKSQDNQVDNSHRALFESSTKAWYFFKKGSFWTYRNDSTNLSDSLVIDSSLIQLIEPGGPYPTEELNIYFKPNVFNFAYEKMSSRAECDPGLGLYFNDSSQYYAFPGFVCSFDTVGRIFYFKDENQHITGYRKILNFFPDFVTEAGIIPNVYVIELKDLVLNTTKHYYIAKNFGIIKQQYQNSIGFSSWTVVRMKIVQ